METVRAAVIGVGYLGAFHAEKYATLEGVELVAVVDADPTRSAQVAENLGCRAITDYRELAGQVDAVSIVVPTQAHYQVAEFFLSRGVHVLVEKPFTNTLDEADRLIALAEEGNLCLQVGHLERFNPAVKALEGRVDNPLFVESHRVAPFKPRGTDVSVVLDLMIHDIDIILDLVKRPLERIDASGASVISPHVDIINTRLQFEGGCVANITASRVSRKSERKMRIFQADAYFAVDFEKQKLEIRRKGKGEVYPGYPEIFSEPVDIPRGDALLNEVSAFVATVLDGHQPVVSGRDGRQVLAIALDILAQLEQQSTATGASWTGRGADTVAGSGAGN